MPMFDFQCHACRASQELLISSWEAKALVLVCAGCGGDMRAVHSKVTILRGRSPRRREIDRARTGQSCGHGKACRCAGVKLTKPNPFRRQIESALEPQSPQ